MSPAILDGTLVGGEAAIRKTEVEIGAVLRDSLACVLMFASSAANSQSGGASVAGPAFEVASIKPSGPRSVPSIGPFPVTLNFNVYKTVGGPGTSNPGQFTCSNITLKPLLLRAYDLHPYELVGPDSMIDSDKWDIVAKVPGGATKEQFKLMIQNLLVERFGLIVHRETRDLPVYELIVAKGGSKLRESVKPVEGAAVPVARCAPGKNGLPELPPGAVAVCVLPAGPNTRLAFRAQSLAELLHMMETQIGRKVIDKTGLAGKYDFDLTWSMRQGVVGLGRSADADASAPQTGVLDAEDSGPTLLAAIQSQLGLEFESKKGPAEVLVVDHVNKTPTEN